MNYGTLETVCRVLADRVNVLEAELYDEREMETSSVLDMCCRIYPLKLEGNDLLIYPGVGEYISLNDLHRFVEVLQKQRDKNRDEIDDLREGNDALNLMLNNVREEKEALRQQSMKADDIIHQLRRRLREAHLDASLPGVETNSDDDEIIVTDDDRSYGPRR